MDGVDGVRGYETFRFSRAKEGVNILKREKFQFRFVKH